MKFVRDSGIYEDNISKLEKFDLINEDNEDNNL